MQGCRLKNQQTSRNPFENILLHLSSVGLRWRHSLGWSKITSYLKVTKYKPPERLPVNWQKSITHGQKPESQSAVECGLSVYVIDLFLELLLLAIKRQKKTISRAAYLVRDQLEAFGSSVLIALVIFWRVLNPKLN